MHGLTFARFVAGKWRLGWNVGAEQGRRGLGRHKIERRQEARPGRDDSPRRLPPPDRPRPQGPRRCRGARAPARPPALPAPGWRRGGRTGPRPASPASLPPRPAPGPQSSRRPAVGRSGSVHPRSTPAAAKRQPAGRDSRAAGIPRRAARRPRFATASNGNSRPSGGQTTPSRGRYPEAVRRRPSRQAGCAVHRPRRRRSIADPNARSSRTRPGPASRACARISAAHATRAPRAAALPRRWRPAVVPGLRPRRSLDRRRRARS